LKYLEQKPGASWWTKNPRTTLYMIRELSCVPIAFATLTLATVVILPVLAYSIFNSPPLLNAANNFTQSDIFKVIMIIGLVGAVVHTLTWLSVMPQILPVKLPKPAQYIAYLIFLGIWLGLSFFILQFILV